MGETGRAVGSALPPKTKKKARTPRFHPDTFDASKFEGVVAEAIAAFRTDPSYCIDMVHSATKVIQKRAIWAARMRIREAEAKARSECEASGPAICPVLGGEPCGASAQCPYVSPDLSGLPISQSFGTQTAVRVRPGVDGLHVTYLRDSVTRSLAFPARV